ncbi:MAG: RNA methyltransferase [Bacteroidota bacterium]
MQKRKNEDLGRLSTAEYQAAPKNPFCLVLDNIRSMHNVGSAFRTGDAFRVEKIYLCGITAQPPHREIQKTALGATESVQWEYREATADLLKELKNKGYRIVLVEQIENGTYLHDFQVQAGEAYAFVFGNEVQGIQESLLELGDIFLEIPQYGTKHSLNITVSMGIVIWDFLSKLGRRS